MALNQCISHVGRLKGAKMKNFVLFVSLLALSNAVGCGGGMSTVNNNGGSGGGPAPASVSGTIGVGDNPSAIAVDSTSNRIYVTDFGGDSNDGICQTCYCPGINGSLTVIDGETEAATTTGFSYAYQNPFDLAVNPANHSLYVVSRVFPNPTNPTCGYGGQVDAIDMATLTQTNTTYVGRAVEWERVAVNEQTSNVYVTSDDTFTVLDGTGNVLATITLPAHPTALAVNTSTNKIYVDTYCTLLTCSDNVTVIDGFTNSIASTITDPNITGPATIAVNPTTNTIYVASAQTCSSCPIPDILVVIDGDSNSVRSTISVGVGPTDVAVNPQTNYIYVANGFHDNNPGSVSVINGATNTIQTLTDASLVSPSRIAVNATTNRIYVVSSGGNNNITVIDGAHN